MFKSQFRLWTTLSSIIVFLAIWIVPPVQAQVRIASKEGSKTSEKSSFSRTEIKARTQIVTRSLAIIPGNRPLIDELEILDYQIDQLKQLQYDFRQKLGEVVRESRDKKLDSAGREKLFLKALGEVDHELSEILLPHQKSRLKQVAFQSLGLTPNGEISIPNMLSNPMMRSQLPLKESTLIKIRRKLKEESKRVAEEIAKVKRESRERILEILTAEEKEELEKIIGPVFDFQGYVPSAGDRFRKSKDDH